MRTSLMLALALAGGCTKATSASDNPRNDDRIGDRTGVAPRPPQPAATVTLTSVLFADDCGASAPMTPPPAPPPTPLRKEASPAAMAPRDRAGDVDEGLAARRCEQTSMQLAITASRDTEVRIVSIEVFDEAGASLGALTPSHPTRWADDASAYQPWDQRVRRDETARVSYVLSQPSFIDPWTERDRTYTVKVRANVGGVEQPLQTTVMVVARPAPMPT